jgi:hypothetical protein
MAVIKSKKQRQSGKRKTLKRKSNKSQKSQKGGAGNANVNPRTAPLATLQAMLPNRMRRGMSQTTLTKGGIKPSSVPYSPGSPYFMGSTASTYNPKTPVLGFQGKRVKTGSQQASQAPKARNRFKF